MTSCWLRKWWKRYTYYRWCWRCFCTRFDFCWMTIWKINIYWFYGDKINLLVWWTISDAGFVRFCGWLSPLCNSNNEEKTRNFNLEKLIKPSWWSLSSSVRFLDLTEGVCLCFGDNRPAFVRTRIAKYQIKKIEKKYLTYPKRALLIKERIE